MRILSPGSLSGLRQLRWTAALAASTLLLALALGCGAAEQPGDPASQPVPASQSLPVLPADPPQRAAKGVTTRQGSQEVFQDIAEADQPAKGDSRSGSLKSTTSRNTAGEQAAGSPPMEEAKAEPGARDNSSTMTKTVDSQPDTEPSTGSAQPHAAYQDSALDQQMGGTTEDSSAPTAMETTPAPPEVPQVPETAAADFKAEVGNQVGNRIPDFTLDLVNGATVSTTGLVEEGSPTFLFFTSTT